MAVAMTETLAHDLVDAGRRLERRGWALGTSGNFSSVVSREPFLLAITASGVDKASLSPEQVVTVGSDAAAVAGSGAPSAETHLHLAVIRVRGAGAVLHTHSVWSTLLSDLHAERGEVVVTDYEMLKGLSGVKSHEHEERVPILDNSQDMPALARRVEATLRSRPKAHAFLLRKHGLYTWGSDLAEAVRHVEILEFLFEVIGRRGRA
jgi:methylthioribulose-1-phosphate dehydratase